MVIHGKGTVTGLCGLMSQDKTIGRHAYANCNESLFGGCGSGGAGEKRTLQRIDRRLFTHQS